MFGTEEKIGSNKIQTDQTINSYKTSSLKKVPDISWDELVDLKKIDYKKKISSGQFRLAGEKVGENSYALIVKDDDMMPRYEPGSLLIVDPDYPLHHKNKVIFLIDGKTPTCKQLIIDTPKFYLKSHAEGYSPIEIGKSDVYCGSIRQVFMDY
jgi:SOS-response transcriptional repressor LexA